MFSNSTISPSVCASPNREGKPLCVAGGDYFLPMSTYTVTLDDGRKVDQNSRSASDAIQGVLEKYLGHKIKACRLTYGGMAFEVPKHDALPLDWSPVPKRSRAQKEPCTLFDDTQIQEDSLRALHKAETPVFK